MNQRIRNQWAALLLAGVLAGCVLFAALAATPDPRRATRSQAYQRGYEAGYQAAKAETKRTAQREKAPRHETPGKYARHASDIGFPSDTSARAPRFMHRLSAEFRPEYIFPTNPFLKHENRTGNPSTSRCRAISATRSSSARGRPPTASTEAPTRASGRLLRLPAPPTKSGIL